MINSKNELHLGKYSWKTVIKALIAIMLVYALLGWLLVSSPFAFYVARGTSLNYSRIFYLHGLTVGFAGITCLLVSYTFNLRQVINKIIFYATIICVLIGVTGGAINRSMKFKWTLWYQILSMFALDVILISMFVGFILVKDKAFKKTTTYWTAALANLSALIAGLFGDAVGYLMDFGGWPGIQVWYAHKIGYTLAQWQDALLRTHSDMMVVSVLCLLLATANYKFGQHLIGNSQKVRKAGEVLMITGIIVMLAIYLVSGLGGAGVQIPHIFTEKGFFELRGHSLAGVDLGDFMIGVLNFLGGILMTAAAAFGKRAEGQELSKNSLRTARGIFLAMVCIFLGVVGMGFLEEYEARLYNSDYAWAPLGNFGFIFRLLHVDVCLLLFPAMMLIMLLAERTAKAKDNQIIQYILRTGIVIAFIGALIFMVVNYHSFGPGTWPLAVGIFILICGIIYFLFVGKDKKKD